ncbi:MAG TPA: anti-sigma factor [Bryobacteraceae bacterium]|nr:anti-sigma factor [Bryobacteraceae bacterium]
MACEQKPEMLVAYMDGELGSAEAVGVEQHVLTCPECAVRIAEQMQLRRSLTAARGRYAPDSAWKNRVLAGLAPRRHQKSRWWTWVPAAVAACAVLVLLAGMWIERRSARDEAFREVADLHVSDLASDHPVDVISTDRHTVKPWFTGRIPFSFNVPEFAGTEFSLIGGRVAYLQQQPGAQLIVGVKQHRISVLLFRESPELDRVLPAGSAAGPRAGFNAATWNSGGLRCVVIGDADAGAIDSLAQRFRQANP